MNVFFTPSKWKQFASVVQIRKIAGSSGALLISNSFASGLGFITTALIAQAIGLDGLGTVVLVQTIIAVVAAAVLPKPWPSLIRYGVSYKTRGELDKLRTLLFAGLTVEIIAGLLAFLLVLLGINFLNIEPMQDPTLRQALLIFATTLIFEVPGFPTTLYRMFRRYKLQSVVLSINALFLFFLILLAFSLKVDVVGFIIAYTIAKISGSIINLAIALYIMYAEGLLAVQGSKFAALSDSSGIVPFGISMHFTDLLGTIMREVDYLVIAYFLGPTSVGVMKILKQCGRPFTLLTDSIRQIIYPEACELYIARGFKSMIKYLTGTTALLAIVSSIALFLLMLIMPFLLSIAFGAEYKHLSGIVNLYLIIHVGFLLAQSLQISALALGQGAATFHSYVIMNTIYIFLLITLAPRFDISGVILAFAAGAVAWTIWMIEINRRGIQRERKSAYPSEHFPQPTLQ